MQVNLAIKLILLAKLCHQTQPALINGNYQCRRYSVLNSTDVDLVLAIVLTDTYVTIFLCSLGVQSLI